MLAGRPDSCCGSARVHLKAAPIPGNDQIITGVTVTQVRRESLGGLSSRTAVLLRVEIRSISFKKRKTLA